MVAGRVRQVAILYSNDCQGIAWADSALVVLDDWSSYRGGRLNMFDCIFSYGEIKDSFKGHFLFFVFQLCIRRRSSLGKDIKELKRREMFEAENFKNFAI